MAGTPESAMASPGCFAWFRIMSLDVVLGTVAGAAAAQTFYGALLPKPWLLVLALSVWAIYSADHLLDARKMGEQAHTPRHRYHYLHWMPIAVIAGLSALAAVVVAILVLGETVVWFGLGMGGLTALHLLLVKLVGSMARPWLVKEFGVALIYTLGVWGLPLLVSGKWVDWQSWVPVVQFFLVGMMNLLVFSIYERVTDALDGQTSIVQALGERFSKRFAVGLGIILAVLALVSLWFSAGQGWLLQVVVLSLGAVQLGLLMLPGYFQVSERYRLVGDAAFAFPFLYVLVEVWN